MNTPATKQDPESMNIDDLISALVSAGGTKWQSEDGRHRRMYFEIGKFDLPALSATRAARLNARSRSARFWFDLNARRFYYSGLPGLFDVARAIRQQVEDAANIDAWEVVEWKR